MKTLITAVALLMALSVPAQAEQASCDEIAAFAEQIMTARQRGMALSKALNLIEGMDTLRPMILEAWEVRAYQSGPRQERAVREYGESWFLMCYRAR
jgi:hypothetical protein